MAAFDLTRHILARVGDCTCLICSESVAEPSDLGRISGKDICEDCQSDMNDTDLEDQLETLLEF